MNLNGNDKSFKMKIRDVETAFKYRRIPYPKRSVELIALLAISCTFFLFMHTNKLNSRLKEMEVKLQPSEFSALGLTGSNHISGRDGSKHDDINTLHGTYQYLKSTGQLQDLTTQSLNNTPKAEVDILFFNRVPKVGSEAMMKLLKLLALRNGFNSQRDKPSNMETILVTPEFELNLVDEIMSLKEPSSYSKHVAYLDFKAIDYLEPIYVNLVRDPVERLISWFYYIRAPWFIAERQRHFPNQYKVPGVKWLKKDFDSCILQHDPECVYNQGDTRGLGDHRRQMLFFCGQDLEICMPFNSYDAMQLAKRNVETHYAVVGSWEDTNVTLSVLEYYIPRFFAGAADVYFKPANRLHKINRNLARPPVSQKVREILSKNLTNEIEFYQFCKQRLYKQFIAKRPRKPRSNHNDEHQDNADSHIHKANSQLHGPHNEDKVHHGDNEPVHQHQHKKRHGKSQDADDYDADEDFDYGDLEDYDNDDEINIKADLLNNTKKAEVDVLFFNRVPKVGSQSLMELMARLGQINGYVHSRNKGAAHETIMLKPQKQREFISDLLTKNKPQAYSQHIAYINFTRFHMPKPIYVNLIRDPIERIISWHYYIRAPWYYKDMKAKLGDLAPPTPPDDFMNMDIDTCVRTNDKHCQFNQMEIKNAVGDHRRQTLFFCGQNRKLCMPFNSEAAMQKAKRTVEEDYAVVGTWEDTNITLTVLEHYVPKFFKHAKVAYYLGKDRLANVNRNNLKKPASDETREILRKNMTNEIEFYEFCKQRLYLQYSAINGANKIDNDDYLLIPANSEEEEDDKEY